MVDFNPFFFTTQKEKVEELEVYEEAQYIIRLKKRGSPLVESKLDAKNCIDWSPGDYCGEYDHSAGLFFLPLQYLTELPDEIIIFHNYKEIYTLKEPSTPFPSISIKKQEYSEGLIKIEWTVSEVTDSLHYYALVSNSDFQKTMEGGSWKTLPLFEDSLNNDGSAIFENNAFNFSPYPFIEGDLQVALYVTDGFRTKVAYSQHLKLESPQ